MDEILLAFVSGIVVLVYSAWLAFSVNRAPTGNEKNEPDCRSDK